MGGIKSVIKSVLPKSMVRWVVASKRGVETYRDSVAQASRFIRSSAAISQSTLEALEAYTLFHSHQIEKGLSHEEFRCGFGKRVLERLSSELNDLMALDSSYCDNFAFQTALGALRAYQVRHEEEGFDTSEFEKLFDPVVWEAAKASKNLPGGTVAILASDKTNNDSLTFRELFTRRFSIREFAEKPIEIDVVKEAVSLAMKTPSVCNRQPTRVKVVTNAELIDGLLSVHKGLVGYRRPPALILLTADNRYLFSSKERNEGFVDGGLFGMSLLLALESLGVASCPLNAMMRSNQEREIRKMLRISDFEFLVMFIAIGAYPERSHGCVSRRMKADDVTTIIN